MTKITKVLLILEIVTLILLILLGFFLYPQADDFSFANSLNNFGWLGSQINKYKTWFGRFSSTMLMISACYINLSVLCKIFPVVIIFGYLFAFYLAAGKLLPDVSKKFRSVFALTFFLLYVSGMPSLSQGIYWFCGTATYAPANIAIIIFLSYFDSIKNNKIYICLILLGIFVVGSNEVVMLLLMFFVCAKLLREYKNKRLWLMLAVFVLFSLVVVLAPGNAVRSSMFVGNHDFVLSVLKSLKALIILLVKWLLNPLLWIAALAFSYFRKMLNFKIVCPQKKTILVIGFALFLMFCTLFTAFWSMNDRPPERVLNTTYLIFLFIFTFCVCQMEIRGFMPKIKKKIAVPILVLWISLNFFTSSVPQIFYLANMTPGLKFITISCNHNNMFVVYRDVFSGKIFDYRRTMTTREEKLKNYQGGLLCLPKVERLPSSIVFQDLYEDSEFWINRVFAEYYHVEKVAVCDNN